MSRFELSISPTYVPNWGLTEAIRELFQNALDQQTANPSNKMAYEYSPIKSTLWISSKESVLEKSSLLLGCSSKADDPTTIGKFGEGYKLALLVLTRLGYKVTIYNYAAKEVWTPRIIKSRRYDSDLLVIDVNKHIFKSVPDSNLTFMVKGVTESDCQDDIVDRTLFLQDYKDYTYSTSKGEILLDECHAGMLFVNGLYINTVKTEVATKGYNFNPDVISLDRDRSLVSSFDLQWVTSQMWAEITDSDCKDMILSDAPDVEYLKNFTYRVQGNQLAEDIFDSFQCANGPTSIPVSKQWEADDIKKNYPSLKAVIVSDNIASVISKSDGFSYIKAAAKITVEYKTVKQRILYLLDEYGATIPQEFITDLEEILEDLNE